MIKKSDIMIAGGGMIGLSLAIGLASKGVEVAVFEKDTPESQLEPAFDGRVSAVSLGSVRVLENIGVWQDMQPTAQPIRDIRVVDHDSHSFVHYNHKEAGDEPMGYMVENRHNRIALLKRARELPTLTLVAPATVTHMVRDACRAEVTLSDGTRWHAPLLVAADGRHSGLRGQAGIGTIRKQYNQSAIVCTIEHELPHEGLAMQRFMPAGPFAALPMQGGFRTAIVWSEAAERVPAIMELPEEEFLVEIGKRLGTYLGSFTRFGNRFSYPLTMVLAKEFIAGRFALVGDSAHGIHPVAGQGVNIGFRDVAVMIELVTQAMRLGQDIGAPYLLEHYQRWRRFDALSMGAIMDGIVTLFSNDVAIIRHARDAGLDVVNRTPPLKRLFMKHAMGLMGDLPEMMRKAG